MKLFKISSCLTIEALTLFSISTANAGGCSSYTERKTEFESCSDDKNFLDAKQKELLIEVEV